MNGVRLTRVRSRSRAARHVVYSVSLAALVAHFALTLLYVMPPNPIKTRTSLHTRYIDRYFFQEWALFAPQPISVDIAVLVRCNGPRASTPFVNLAAKFWEQKRRRPFSPYLRLGRSIDGQAYALLTTRREERPLVAFCLRQPDHPICPGIEKAREFAKDANRAGLLRVASAFCADASDGDDHRFDAATIEVEMSPVPRWSRRHEVQDRTRSTIALGTHALVPISGFGLWRDP